MAEKPGFLMLHNTFRALDVLPDDQFRAMLRAMCDYSENGSEPDFDDASMRVMFAMIRDGLDIDAARYERKVEQRRQAIEKRWANERIKKNSESASTVSDNTAYESIRPYTTVYDRIRPNTDEYERYQPQPQPQPQPQLYSLSPYPLSEEREIPTLEMVQEYAREAGLDVDARQFMAQNDATGWVDGNGHRIKSWRIWLQGWARMNRPGARPTRSALDFEQRAYTEDELRAVSDAAFEAQISGKGNDNA